jgi:hypothetical protein
MALLLFVLLGFFSRVVVENPAHKAYKPVWGRQGFEDSRIQGAKWFFSNDFISALGILSTDFVILKHITRILESMTPCILRITPIFLEVILFL